MTVVCVVQLPWPVWPDATSINLNALTTMPICTSCTHPIPYLYTVYESAYNLRLEQCVSFFSTNLQQAWLISSPLDRMPHLRGPIRRTWFFNIGLGSYLAETRRLSTFTVQSRVRAKESWKCQPATRLVQCPGEEKTKGTGVKLNMLLWCSLCIWLHAIGAVVPHFTSRKCCHYSRCMYGAILVGRTSTFPDCLFIQS